ncbi:MAG: hypothetical protein ACLQOO_33030 [Terriglobia bacterium]
MANDEGISERPFSSALSAARLAANRRNAQKSTGPKTKAGKRRVALNARSLGFAPPEIERQLRARGEDARDFRRLHRDVADLFPAQDATGEAAVQLVLVLAMTRSLRSGQALVGEGEAYPQLGGRRSGSHQGSGREDRGVARVPGERAETATRAGAGAADGGAGTGVGRAWRRAPQDRAAACSPSERRKPPARTHDQRNWMVCWTSSRRPSATFWPELARTQQSPEPKPEKV